MTQICKTPGTIDIKVKAEGHTWTIEKDNFEDAIGMLEAIRDDVKNDVYSPSDIECQGRGERQ